MAMRSFTRPSVLAVLLVFLLLFKWTVSQSLYGIVPDEVLLDHDKDGLVRQESYLENDEDGFDTCPAFTVTIMFPSLVHQGHKHQCDNDDDHDDNDDNDNMTGGRRPRKRVVKEFFGTFGRLGVSWDHILRSYRRIIAAAGGQEIKGDVQTHDMQEAVVLFREMVHDCPQSIEMMETIVPKLPLKEFGKTVEDLWKVFLHWAATNGAKKDTKRCKRKGNANGRLKQINVSKAYRRWLVYSAWMKDYAATDLDTTVTAESISRVREAFGMHLSYDDCHRLVWWMDLSKADFDAIKDFSVGEIRRFFVWWAHWIMFDKNAIENGAVLVNSLAYIGFWTFMTILPLEIGIQTDEFMITAVPINCILLCMMDRPAWALFAYRILSVFLSHDMKSRVFMVPGQNQRDAVEKVLGSGFIPQVFDGPLQEQSLETSYFPL